MVNINGIFIKKKKSTTIANLLKMRVDCFNMTADWQFRNISYVVTKFGLSFNQSGTGLILEDVHVKSNRLLNVAYYINSLMYIS
jgi:hypothetical protein